MEEGGRQALPNALVLPELVHASPGLPVVCSEWLSASQACAGKEGVGELDPSKFCGVC